MSEPGLNGSAPDPALVESWPTAAQLSAQLGVSVRTIGRLTQSGQLKRYVAKNGSQRYDPDAVGDAIAAATQTEAESATAKVVLDGSADVLKQALALLQQAHNQIDRMQAPTQIALELLQNENRRLADSALEHHRLHLELVKAREESLTEAHIRQLESTRQEQAEKRKGEIFSGLAKVAPRVLAQLKLGEAAPAAAVTDASQNAQIEATMRLLNRLSREQLEGLLISGFVDEEQAGDIRIILQHAPTTVPPAPGAAAVDVEGESRGD